MRKKNCYLKNKNKALEQIIERQQEVIEAKDIIIDSQTKENDRYVLTFKFIVDVLLLISQLEKVLADNMVLSDAIKLAIATFKVELSKAMQMIQFDGGYSYTFNTSINNDNSDWGYEEDRI